MIRGRNLHKQLLTAGNKTVFDLSGAAQNEMVLLQPVNDIKINNVYVYWSQTGSADTGKNLTIGSSSGDDSYFTTVSTVSKTAGALETYGEGDMVLSTVPAGTPIWIGHEGGKTGTGEVFVVIAYTIR